MHQTQAAHPAIAAHRTHPRLFDGERDLVALAIFGLLLPLVPFIPIAFLRVPMGLVVALGVPGYALTVTLFPERRDLDGIVRATLSIGMSIAVIPILTLILNALPWGIHAWPMTISLALWTFTLANVARWRRRAMQPADLAFSVTEIDASPHFSTRRDMLTGQHLITAGLVVLTTITVVVLIVPLARPATDPTEFYVLGTEGFTAQYPRQVTPDDTIELTIGVASGEPDERNVRIEAWAVKESGSNDTMMLTRMDPVRLHPQQVVEQPITFQMPWIGDDQQVEILLFREDDEQPIRQLSLWVDVVDDTDAIAP